mmetsp:Transcript_40467/g.52098  ORF Transcript_40467/g.52098 Transcript_40467/m.52098 type:complete len:1141 (+) Transcript_40467:75-3497(+)
MNIINSSEVDDNTLPPFIGVHIRGPTVRENPEAGFLHFEANESMSTILYEQHSQVFDMVINSKESEESMSRIDDLWNEIRGNIWSRLDCVKEAALFTVGPFKSGKSSILFGDEIGKTAAAGIIPRFVRELFQDGLRGDIPSAVELEMLHIEDENIYDLLDPIPMDPITEESKKLLQLRWSKTCGTYVENVTRHLAQNASEFMELVHEALAIRALIFLNSGRRVDAQSCHLVISISLLAASPNKQIVIPRSTMTFVEVGDVLSMHSHASEAARTDRLTSLTTRAERSRWGLSKCVTSLADHNENRPDNELPLEALPSSVYQQCVLTYLLHGPLSKGSTLWLGCLPPFISRETSPSATNTLTLLESARRMHTASSERQTVTRKGRQNEVIAGIDEELEMTERQLEEAKLKHVNQSAPEILVLESHQKSLHSVRLHLEKSLPQRIQLTESSRTKRYDLINNSGLSLFHRKRLPLHFKGDSSDLATLDLVSGPYLSLQCSDDLCSGRLRVVLEEGPTVIGSEKQLPNIFIASNFVCDFHFACHNTSGALELEILRPNAEVHLSGRLVTSTEHAAERMAVSDIEEMSLPSGGLPRLRHDDWIAFTPACSCMFVVVFHEEVADKLRSGDINAIDWLIPGTVPEWEVAIYQRDALEMLERAATKDEDQITETAAMAIDLLGGIPEKIIKKCELTEAARVLCLVAECNLMATYMDQDYLFEGQAKSFSFDGLSAHTHPSHHRHPPQGDEHKSLDESSNLWIFVDSVSDLVPDAYWTPAKLFGRASLIRECFNYFIECKEDKDSLSNKFPANVDPFYDIPTQKLVGVAYLYLNSINYLISVNETVTVVNFKGDVVGEIDVEMVPMLESHLKALEDEMPIFQTEEANLRKLVGESLLLGIKVISARGLPRNLCSLAFTSFKFFLEGQPLRTGCCAARTTAPRWEQTMSLKLIVNDDLVNYVMNEVLEIELWAAPENLIIDTQASKQSRLCGEKIVLNYTDASSTPQQLADGTEEGDPVGREGIEDEVELLKSQVHDLLLEVDELQRENRSNGELALGLVRSFDKEAAATLKKEKHGRVTQAVKISQEYILNLQERVEQTSPNGPDLVIEGIDSSSRPGSKSNSFQPFTKQKSNREGSIGDAVKSDVCIVC